MLVFLKFWSIGQLYAVEMVSERNIQYFRNFTFLVEMTCLSHDYANKVLQSFEKSGHTDKVENWKEVILKYLRQEKRFRFLYKISLCSYYV